MNVVANIKFVYKLLAMMIHVQNSAINVCYTVLEVVLDDLINKDPPFPHEFPLEIANPIPCLELVPKAQMIDIIRPTNKGIVFTMEPEIFEYKQVVTGVVKSEIVAKAITDIVAFTKSSNCNIYFMPPPM
jgi:hypothetical protein